MKKILGSLLLLGVFIHTPALAKTKYGIRVKTCQFDYDDENFCSDKNMKQFAAAMKTREPNFVQGKILYTYKSANSVVNGNRSSYRLVVINKNKKTAEPFYWAFNPTEQSVNNKGEHLAIEFNKTTPKMCVKGDIEAYRNAYSYDTEYYPNGFCFPYVGNTQDATSAGFAWFEMPKN